MKRGLLVLAVVFLAFGVAHLLKKEPDLSVNSSGGQQEASEGEDKPETAVEIVSMARDQMFSRAFEREGELRSGRDVLPFGVVVDGEGTTRFDFAKGKRTITVTHAIAAVRVNESVNGGKPVVVGVQRYAEQIGESDLTIADLAQTFWDWPNPTLQEETKIRIIVKRPAWVVRLDNPARDGSPYAVVKLSIDQKTGGLLRLEGYNSEGRKVKIAEVVKVQKDKALGRWLAGKIRVESVDQVERRKTRSFLEFR